MAKDKTNIKLNVNSVVYSGHHGYPYWSVALQFIRRKLSGINVVVYQCIAERV